MKWIKAQWKWRLVWLKGALGVFIGMGSMWCATVQSWDAPFVDSLHWWSWSFIIVSILVNAAKDINLFLDRTFQLESDKIKADTEKDDETKHQTTELVRPTIP